MKKLSINFYGKLPPDVTAVKDTLVDHPTNKREGVLVRNNQTGVYALWYVGGIGTIYPADASKIASDGKYDGKAPAPTVSEEKIRLANQRGLDKAAGKADAVTLYTPVYRIAYELGCKGQSLQEAPVVTGYRYSAAPWCRFSRRASNVQISEEGLSLEALDLDREVAAHCPDEKLYYYTGILSGAGEKDEPLILSLDAEDCDYDWAVKMPAALFA